MTDIVGPPAALAAALGTGEPPGAARTLGQAATAPPGRYHNAGTVTILTEARGTASARCTGLNAGNPLHGAAPSNDAQALDALLNAGADLEAPGAAVGDGSPLADAIGFGHWQAARHLIERGARTTLWQAAATGLRSRVRDGFPDAAPPSPEELNAAFWYACHGGQFNAAVYLHGRGADLNWIPVREERTPLDAARRNGADDLVRWLETHGAQSAAQLRSPTKRR